jgi:hypothetical protein
MDNKAYEKYQAQQPVVPRPPRVEPEPMPALSQVEITVIIIFAVAVIYAVYRIIRDIRKPPQQ